MQVPRSTTRPSDGGAFDRSSTRLIGVDVGDRREPSAERHEHEATFARRFGELEAIYQQAPVGLCVLDRELRYLRINERLAEWNGAPVQAHVGRTVRELVPELADQVEACAARVLATGEPLRDVEIAGETPGEQGGVRHRLEQWYPLFDAHGEVVGLNVVVEDVTGQRRMHAALEAAATAERGAREATEQAAARLARLQRVTAALSPALSAGEVADVIMREGFEALGAWGGGVVELAEDGVTYRLLRIAGYPEDAERRYATFPADAPLPAGDVYRTHAPVFVDGIEEWTTRYGTRPSSAPVGHTVDGCAWAALPLLVDGRLLGALTLCFVGPCRFPAEDRAFMASLAHQCAQALARARAYEAVRASERELRRAVESERLARARAESTGRREAQLRRVTEALSSVLAVTDVAHAVIAAGREVFGASAGNLLELVRPVDGVPFVRILASDHFPEAVVAAWNGAPLSMRSPMTEAMREGRVVWYATSADRAARWGSPAPAPFEAAALVPILVHEEVIGGWSLSFTAPRTFSEDDCAFLTTLGRQAGLAMQRARLYDGERAARVRTERLQALTTALARARSLEEVARVVADEGRVVLGAFAAGVGLLDATGAEFRLAALEGIDASLQAGWERFPNDPAIPYGAAVAAGTPLLFATRAEYVARFPAVGAGLAAAGTEASAIVLLRAGDGQALGVAHFDFATAHPFDAATRALLEAVAQQCGEALQRARLAAAERVARERAEALQHVTARLARARTLADVGAVFSAQLATLLGADTAWVGTLDETGTCIEALGWHGYRADEAARWERLALDAPIALCDVVRTRRPQWWPSRAALGGAYPGRRAVIEATRQEAVALLPLVDGDVVHGTAAPGGDDDTPDGATRVVGGLAVGFRTPLHFDPDLRTFLRTLAQQCAQAIARARATAAEEAALASAEHARAEAEAANRAKSHFLATMSHELRTPLNAIAGYTHLLAMGVRGPVTAEQRDDLARIQRSGQHLLGLIDEVLDYARLEAGAVRFTVAAVPVAALLADVETLVVPQVRAKGLSLELRVPDAELAVVADRERARQVLLNLLSNAVKFTPAGGRVCVSCRLATGDGASPCDGDAAGRMVAIAVEDTGIGIAPDEQVRVFEPFVQVGRALDAPSEGTGLGLAISRDLARGMGGDLTVTSAPGAGSTFVLLLPRAHG